MTLKITAAAVEDAEPFTLEFAVALANGDTVAERFRFHGTQNSGDWFAVLDSLSEHGVITDHSVWRYVNGALVDDRERGRFAAFVTEHGRAFPPSTLGQFYDALVAHYSGRPPTSPNGSPRPRSSSGRTSTAAPRSRASGSSRSRSR